MAEALYRKYRPQVFEDVVGQQHIERTLTNAIDQDKVSHAYLFCGPRGTGKTTTARLLAKALLCEKGPTSSPDGTCRECREIAEGTHPDVYELDAASRTGVENVRDEIIGRVNYAPTRGRSKIYIIDEVHMLSTAAFNALLKTLEEPPSHVVFILCTTDPQKVPETIHSRCQRFDFHRLGNDEIVSRLGAVCVGENVEFEAEALELIAHRAEGGMRNALTSLEQLIAFGGGKVTVAGAEDLLGSLDASDMAEIMDAIGRRDVAACFNWTAQYVESGADLAQFCRDMAQRVRDLYVLSLAGTDAALDVAEAERRQMTAELALFGPDRLSRMMSVLGDLLAELRSSTNPRLCFEIGLTRMVRPESDLTLEALAERIEALEAGGRAPAALPSPAFVSTPAPAPEPQQQPMQTQAAASGPYDVPPAQSASAPPQGAPAADPAAFLSNGAALQRAWRSVVNFVKKEKTAYGALLVDVKVRPDEHGGVAIEFPADNSFAYDMAQRPELKSSIEAAFRQVVGTEVPFTLHYAGAEASDAQASGQSAPAAAGTDAQSAIERARKLVQEAASRGAQRTSRASASAAGPPQPPAPAAQQQPVSNPRPPASNPDDVPLDVYESMVPAAADAAAPWEPPAPAPAPEPAAPAPAQTPQDTASADQTPAEQLGTMASNAFGSKITFEEV